VCGLISEYNNFGETSPNWAGKMMRAVLTKRLTIRGFIVSDFAARHGDFLRDMSQWVRERSSTRGSSPRPRKRARRS
jgi:NADPH-dependent curcumin reductase CurA